MSRGEGTHLEEVVEADVDLTAAVRSEDEATLTAVQPAVEPVMTTVSPLPNGWLYSATLAPKPPGIHNRKFRE